MKYLEKNWILIFAFFALLGCIFGGCKNNNDVVIFKQYQGCDYIKFEGYFGWSHSGTCPNPIHIENCPCLGKRINQDTQ